MKDKVISSRILHPFYFYSKRATGFEPVTYSLARNRSTSLSYARVYLTNYCAESIS